MIKVCVMKNTEGIHRITISGHAGFAKYGYDIVCSAVSSVVTTTINAILSFGESICVVDEEPLEIQVVKHDKITDTLLENMMAMLREIENQYEKNIRTEEKNEC